MGKIIVSLILFVLVILLAVYVIQDMLAEFLLKSYLEKFAGLNISTEAMALSLFKSAFWIEGLIVYNPAGYPDKILARISTLYVKYDLPALLKKKISLPELRLQLDELVIIKNKDGSLNVEGIAPIKAVKKEPLEVNISKLNFGIGRLTYIDYARSPYPYLKTFDINLEKTYCDVTNLNDLVKVVISDAVAKASLAQLFGINFSFLSVGKELATGAVKTAIGVTKEVVDTAADTANELKGALKGLIK